MSDDNQLIEVLPATVEVVISNCQAKTTSLAIAKAFDKNHRDVLKSIRSLECSEEFAVRNFAQSSYLNQQGKEQPMYEITRDGAVFLIMGYTGKEAARFKEAYIAAFNRMESELQVIRNEGMKQGIEYARQILGKKPYRAALVDTTYQNKPLEFDLEESAKRLMNWMANPTNLIESAATPLLYSSEGNVIFEMRPLQRYSPFRIKKDEMLELLRHIETNHRAGRLFQKNYNVYAFEFFGIPTTNQDNNIYRIK